MMLIVSTGPSPQVLLMYGQACASIIIICNHHMFLSGSILGDQHPLLRIVFAYEDYPLFMVITWLNNQTHDVSNTIFHNCIILVWHFFFVPSLEKLLVHSDSEVQF